MLLTLKGFRTSAVPRGECRIITAAFTKIATPATVVNRRSFKELWASLNTETRCGFENKTDLESESLESTLKLNSGIDTKNAYKHFGLTML